MHNAVHLGATLHGGMDETVGLPQVQRGGTKLPSQSVKNSSVSATF